MGYQACAFKSGATSIAPKLLGNVQEVELCLSDSMEDRQHNFMCLNSSTECLAGIRIFYSIHQSHSSLTCLLKHPLHFPVDVSNYFVKL